VYFLFKNSADQPWYGSKITAAKSSGFKSKIDSLKNSSSVNPDDLIKSSLGNCICVTKVFTGIHS
jgi:hypothetical protein